MERIVDGSRLPNARMIGFVYLLYFLTGGLAEVTGNSAWNRARGRA